MNGGNTGEMREQMMRGKVPGGRSTPRGRLALTLVHCLLLAGLLLLVGCAQTASGLPPSASAATGAQEAGGPPSATASPLPAMAPATGTPFPVPSPTAAVTVDPGPYPAAGEERCGVLLPVVAQAAEPAAREMDVTQSLDAVPEAARPAVRRMLQAPESVGLAAYETGNDSGGVAGQTETAEGVFLNADTPMPLASAVKVIHLVAYAQAVQGGELNPEMTVPLAELERYYLPHSDLNAHRRAVEALSDEGRVSGEPPAVLLEDVPRMMIEYSSNAATDYLHQLLGQERIERTILDLGLTSHSAPCPFLGQFLLMGAGGNDLEQVSSLIRDPERYSREVWRIAQQYAADGDAREEPGGWQRRGRRPSLAAQALFSEGLNARASAGDYARLMALIANNQIAPWEQNVRIRRYLEWPTHIPANQETLAWLGYKGGTLPGVLTAAYYAQPWDRAQPVVAAVFFHDIPLDMYRQWRHTLPQDELARWLLYDREAIPTLRALLSSP